MRLGHATPIDVPRDGRRTRRADEAKGRIAGERRLGARLGARLPGKSRRAWNVEDGRIGDRQPVALEGAIDRNGGRLAHTGAGAEKRVDAHEQRGKRNKTKRTHYTKI